MVRSQIITLTEYETIWLNRAALSEPVAQHLWQHYAAQVQLEPPSFKTQQRWQLTAQGWVGFIPLTPQLGLALQPRVAVRNLLRMLLYAYELDQVPLPTEQWHVATLPEFYEQLALGLARGLLHLRQQGFYTAYIPQRAPTLPLRGRIDVAAALRQPGQIALPCTYEEQTLDIEDNQLLAWTLWAILASGLCGEATRVLVRQAYRTLAGLVTVQPLPASACLGRHYHRLNQAYKPLHTLCYFFLSHTGPGYAAGTQAMFPFLLEMARVYERFVAAWLQRHLGRRWRVQRQERYSLGANTSLYFTVDLIVAERQSGVVRWVMDTKYKTPTTAPSTADIAQVIAYAQRTGAPEAILIYPTPLPCPIDLRLGKLRVRSLVFDLTSDLATAGQDFVNALLQEAEDHLHTI
jgi:5-methylcytosine-specific restriction enzyme subunit McrC